MEQQQIVSSALLCFHIMILEDAPKNWTQLSIILTVVVEINVISELGIFLLLKTG